MQREEVENERNGGACVAFAGFFARVLRRCWLCLKLSLRDRIEWLRPCKGKARSTRRMIK